MAFIVLTLVTFFFYPLCRVSSQKSVQKRAEKVYCIVMAVLLVLFIGLRSKNIGIDSPDYANTFYNSPKFSWDVAINFLKQKEFLFKILQSIVRSFTSSYTVWFLLAALMYVIPLTIFIYKKSEFPFLSFILFMSMAYMNFVMAGLRQTMASSFLIVSFWFLTDKKYIRFIIFVVIASCFHITALVFLLGLFVTRDKIKARDIIIFLVILVFFVLFGVQLVEKAIDIVFKDTRGYTTDESGGYSTFALFLIVAVASLVFDKKITTDDFTLWKRKDNKEAFCFRFLLIATLFQYLAIYQANCFRIAMYFSLFPMLTIIPNAIERQRDIVIKAVGMVSTTCLLLFQLFCLTYFESGVNPYQFFWEIL